MRTKPTQLTDVGASDVDERSTARPNDEPSISEMIETLVTQSRPTTVDMLAKRAEFLSETRERF